MEEEAKTKKRVAIVGAGPSGLSACKHLLARGFRPVVFDAGAAVGGVWRRTLASTRLQTPAATYRFSDFPWPPDAESSFPRHDEVAAYLTAYARRFGVLERVRFGCTVLGASYYVNGGEVVVAAWERWSGNGEAFGDGTGEWRLTVREEPHDGGESPPSTQVWMTVGSRVRFGCGRQVHRFDFLILCVGRYGVPKLPSFPDGRGPEAFRGRVLHSMEYASMPHADAAELVRGKRVVVVGAGKSALDTAAQCAEINGRRYPCTLVYRSAHWMMDPDVARRVFGSSTRLAELMVHKPGEGLALSLLATVLTPLRWLLIKARETYLKAHIPMEKHGMVPDYSLARCALGWRLGTLPRGFYRTVDEGGIELRKCARGGSSLTFCADGLVLDNDDDDNEGDILGADVVILSTGFDPDAPLRGIFTSPHFRATIAGADDNTMLPLYRHCVHPRIPQLAVVGYAESGASVYSYEMMAKWVAHLLDGRVRLSKVDDMERDVAEWERWGRWARRSSGGGFFLKSCVHAVTTWYHDRLCRDMGHRAWRKTGGVLAEWMQPYGPADYAGIQ